MNIRSSIKGLTRFEIVLWVTSIVVCLLSFLLSPSKDYLTLISSLFGVTALIFISKGYVLGQILIIIFSLFYGVVSFYFQYYGEMITYLGMSLPIAIFSTISWIRHPYENSQEVTVNKISFKKFMALVSICAVVTTAFYFILGFLGTANLIPSTISVATSFFAASLSLVRSPYYALAYSCNDIVLIILWILASFENIAYFPMVICFVMFFVNDIYGYYNWKKMMKRQ